MRLALAQLNPIVGDLPGNLSLIRRAVEEARTSRCDLVLFPELTLTGYPPEDLIFKPEFIQDNLRAVRSLASSIKDMAVVVGFVDEERSRRYNAAAWIEDGAIRQVYRKKWLPNYGVFDEERYFEPGGSFKVLSFKGVRTAITICEDIWFGSSHLKELKKLKPRLVLNLSASPFHAGKIKERMAEVRRSAHYLGATLFLLSFLI